MRLVRAFLVGVLCLCRAEAAEPSSLTPAVSKATQSESAQDELGVTTGQASHTLHPDAQWFPEAGLGLFIHWGISSVKAMNISWPMVPGRALAKERITDPLERDRIIRESDYNLDGKPPEITPNQYWEMAKDFNPQRYDPEKWLKAAKEAGFIYAVLTTRHHEGFALWPSAYGGFNTSNYMGGRDLVKPFVEACRHTGVKVGLYYSPPDWHFDRDYMSFLYSGARRLNPEFPALDADLKPRTTKKSSTELHRHQEEYAALVKGQVEELLSRYGKIDLLWFDGKPAIPNASQCITIERIRELQPGIVINGRLHGHGDFTTYERKLTTDKVSRDWAELCNPWTSSWSYMDIPFRANGNVLAEFVTCRALGINYLLGVGPMASGELCDGIYENMAVVADWMKKNGAAVHNTHPLPTGESASVPATASNSARFLFALPLFKEGHAYDKDLLPPVSHSLTLKGIVKPTAVKLLGGDAPLKYIYENGVVTISLPASQRTKLVDVVVVSLTPAS